jgi:hypothetical protein
MMFLNSRKNVSDELHVHSLDGSRNQSVPAYKYLGIWIDMDLTFKKHLDKLVKKLRFKTSFFFKNKTCLSLSSRKQVIQSTFFICS